MLMLFALSWKIVRINACKALAKISNENQLFDVLNMIACNSFSSSDSIF